MNGLIVLNKFYSDLSQEYVKRRLEESFCSLDVSLTELDELFGSTFTDGRLKEYDFCVFWDKDIVLAEYLSKFMPVFNSPAAIAVCDDKAKTVLKLIGSDIPLIPSVFSPLAYKTCAYKDCGFIKTAENAFSYPMIIKENVGSLGRQVKLVKTHKELEEVHKKLFYIPHSAQKFIDSDGEVRCYIVGGKTAAVVRRYNESSFISNLSYGGKCEKYAAGSALKDMALYAAKILGLTFGAIDFLKGKDGQFYFLEANSNAYFKGIEELDIDIAGRIAAYICKKLSTK